MGKSIYGHQFWPATLQRVFTSKVFSPSIPVNAAISWSTSHAITKNKIPSNAQVTVFLALSSAFGSPPDVKNLIPAKTKTTNKATKASPTKREITLENTASICVRPAASGPRFVVEPGGEPESLGTHLVICSS